MEFSSSKRSPQNQNFSGRHFRFGAFLNHCTRSVQGVISGWRVVVKYDIYEEAGDDNQGGKRKSNTEKAIAKQVASCLDNKKSVGTSNIINKDQSELVQAVSQFMAEELSPTEGVAFFLRHRYSLPALDEVVLKGVDRIIFDAFSKQEGMSVSVQGVLVYVEYKKHEQVSVDFMAVSMKDFMPALFGNDIDDQPITDVADGIAASGENRKRKEVVTNRERCNVHLIVDENNGADCIYTPAGEEPPDGCNTYFVGCMLIRSFEDGKPPAKQQYL
jgi:hypothetical protein